MRRLPELALAAFLGALASQGLATLVGKAQAQYAMTCGETKRSPCYITLVEDPLGILPYALPVDIGR